MSPISSAVSSVVGVRSFSIGGGGGTSTLCASTGVRATSSVSEDTCAGMRGDVGVRGRSTLSWCGTVGGISGSGGGGAPGEVGGNLKFLLIVPLRAREGFSSESESEGDSPSSSVTSKGCSPAADARAFEGGDAAVERGGGSDCRLAAREEGELAC